MDWKATLLQGSSVMIPLLWSQFGPLVIRTITGVVNKISNQYVPREMQVMLSAILGAVIAGLSGDSTAVMALASGAGIGSQLYTMADPKAMKASAA